VWHYCCFGSLCAGASIPIYRWRQMHQGQFGGNFIKSLTNFSIQKNPYNNCCQMRQQNTHQNRCRLELCPGPHCGSLQHSPRPPSWFQVGHFAARGKWREGLGDGKAGVRGNGEGKGKWGSWGGIAPCLLGE